MILQKWPEVRITPTEAVAVLKRATKRLGFAPTKTYLESNPGTIIAEDYIPEMTEVSNYLIYDLLT